MAGPCNQHIVKISTAFNAKRFIYVYIYIYCLFIFRKYFSLKYNMQKSISYVNSFFFANSPNYYSFDNAANSAKFGNSELSSSSMLTLLTLLSSK